MRVHVIIARTDCVPCGDVGVFSDATPRHVLDADLNHKVNDVLVSHDLCLIYPRPASVEVEDLLASVKMKQKIVQVLQSYALKSCDVSVELYRTSGYILRLSTFATALARAVNRVEHLRTTTVVVGG